MRKHLLRIFFTAVLLALCIQAFAAPVDVKVEQRQLSATEIEVVLSATIAPGWHIYAPDCPPGGPIPASLTTEKAVGAKAVGTLKAQGNAKSMFEPMFGQQVIYYEGQVVFSQRYKINVPKYAVNGYLEYTACNAQSCMPPTTVEFALKSDDKATTDVQSASASKPASDETNAQKPASDLSQSVESEDSKASEGNSLPSEEAAAKSGVDNDSIAAAGTILPPQVGANGGIRSPYIGEEPGVGAEGSGIWSTFLLGLLGGLVALLTPCVWPVIPMTVSFFLRRSDNQRKRAIRDALVYGAAIVVIYMALALLFTAIFGPENLNAMATNAPLNIVFTLLLVVFAMSLMGWFELSLPASWANKVDSKATATGGVLSIFLMAFTLAIVSFSCTCPIVGLLLVDFATSGQWLAPAVGMLGFALALALPFTLFALFPSWLKKAPKSGAWMNQLKVTLAFVELAFACKFFSVADLAYGWQIMSRDAFLAIWIALFAVLGLYLLGLFNFQSDGEPRKARPVASIMAGMASLAFAAYMVPGLWGAPCKAVSAFAPPMTMQQFNIAPQEHVAAQYNSYDEGLAAAAAQGKPVLIDFTGFGCVNCRKMEASIWTDERVAKRLKNDYVLVSLYVDDRRKLESPITVTNPDGTTRILRTVGDRWSHLEQSRFGHLSQPLYVALAPNGQPLSKPFGYTEDPAAFADILDQGIKAFQANVRNAPQQ